jgi:hypothetical protein
VPGTVLLEHAPAEVIRLLESRWLAELLAARASPRGDFVLRWHTEARATSGPGSRAATPAPVRFRPGERGGSFVGSGGRVVWAGGNEATVELASDCARRPDLLEPLVEAALTLALAHLGACFIHAAAMEIGARRLLVMGETGSGKSTLAAAVVACGGRVVSDDSLLLTTRRGRPLVRTARSDLWIRPGTPGLLSELRRQGRSFERFTDGRRRLRRRHAAEVFSTCLVPDGLVLLRRDLRLRRLHIQPRTQAEALGALARGTSAVYLSPRAPSPRLLEMMIDTVQTLPAVELRLGRWLAKAPCECLEAIEAALPSAPDGAD